MATSAKIQINNDAFDFPVVAGTENELAIDISKLRSQTGYITIDTGFKNCLAMAPATTLLAVSRAELRPPPR